MSSEKKMEDLPKLLVVIGESDLEFIVEKTTKNKKQDKKRNS